LSLFDNSTVEREIYPTFVLSGVRVCVCFLTGRTYSSTFYTWQLYKITIKPCSYINKT